MNTPMITVDTTAMHQSQHRKFIIFVIASLAIHASMLLMGNYTRVSNLSPINQTIYITTKLQQSNLQKKNDTIKNKNIKKETINIPDKIQRDPPLKLQQSNLQKKNDTIKDKNIKKETINIPNKIQLENPSRKKLPDAIQLMQRSLDFIHSQPLKELDSQIYPFFGQPAIDSRLLTPSPSNQTAPIEFYKLSTGNTKIKIKSLFGGYQCFEIPEENLADDFSAKIWVFTRC